MTSDVSVIATWPTTELLLARQSIKEVRHAMPPEATAARDRALAFLNALNAELERRSDANRDPRQVAQELAEFDRAAEVARLVESAEDQA